MSVPPTFPGLIRSINPKIKIGGAEFLFDVAWMFGVSVICIGHLVAQQFNMHLQFCVASIVYSTTSLLFPARRTFMEQPIISDEILGDANEVEKPSNRSLT